MKVEGPFEIVRKHGDDSKKSLGNDFDRAVKLFRELENEWDDFRLKLEQ